MLVLIGLLAAGAMLPGSAEAIENFSYWTRLLVNEANVQVGDNAAMALIANADNDIDVFVTDQDAEGAYAATVQVVVDLPENGFYFAHNLVGCGKSKSDATTVLAIDVTNNNN